MLSSVLSLAPPPAFTIIIMCVCSRWTCHLRSPLVRLAEERSVCPAQAGGCDKVEGVSNEIRPGANLFGSKAHFLRWFDKLSALLTPKETVVLTLGCLPRHRSEQNEYRVNTAAVRRIGDVLCKLTRRWNPFSDYSSWTRVEQEINYPTKPPQHI